MDDERIIVRGTGHSRAMPDRAVLRVTVDGEGRSRDDAYRTAAPRAQRVDEVIAAHEAAVDRAMTGALVVQPRTQWRKGADIRVGWRASRTTVVEVKDFARLGSFVAELVEAGGEVRGPAWQLDPANAAHVEARRLAAEDARGRAEAYASALGLKVQGIAWVAEPGLRIGDGSRRGGIQAVGLAARGAEAMAADAVIEISPDEMSIEAEVEVAFAFAPEA